MKHDIEFDIELKKYVTSLYEDNKSAIKSNHLDVDEDTELGIIVETDADRFWLVHREEIRQYLVKECGYKHYGTGVWLDTVDEFKDVPQLIDVKNWFEEFIKGEL